MELSIFAMLFAGVVLSCQKTKSEQLHADYTINNLPEEISPIAAVINRSKLEEAGLPVPYSYQDLLNPIFFGNIAMPNPKTTTTGYKILLDLINIMGEDEAFKYFDNFVENNVQFTEFDSEPLFALTSGKTAIGFCFVSAVVNAVKLTDAPLEICFFEDGLSDSGTDVDINRKKLLLEKWKY